MGRALLALGVVGLVLAGTIILELQGIVADEGAMDPTPLRPGAARPVSAAAPAAPTDGRGGWVEAILARPLFVAGRRPAAAPSGAPTQTTPLPRLAGVLVNGNRRTAIFAAAEGARPVVASEGAQVGAYTVQAIEAGQVTLSGPGGAVVLRPTFDPRGPPSAAAPPAANAAPFTAPPYANATEIMPSLRGLPGFAGPAAR